MKLQINYKKNKIIAIEINDGETVKDLKEKLRYVNKRSSKKPRICAECIVLKYGEIILDNDKCIGDGTLTDNCTLSMSLSVRYQEQIGDSSNSPKNKTIALRYDATVSDMVKQCCDRQNQSDIKVNCGKECKMDDDIRKYLRDKNPIFTITIKDKRPASKSQTNILKEANTLPASDVQSDNITTTADTNQKEDHSQPRSRALTTNDEDIDNKVVTPGTAEEQPQDIILIENIDIIESSEDNFDNDKRDCVEISKSISSVEPNKVTYRSSSVDLKKNKHEIQLKTKSNSVDVIYEKQSYNSMIVIPIDSDVHSPQLVNTETKDCRKSSTDIHPTCARAKVPLHSPQNMDDVSSLKVIEDCTKTTEYTKSETVVEGDNIFDLIEVPKNEEIQIMENMLNGDRCDKLRIEFQPADIANKRDDNINATNINQDNLMANQVYSGEDVTSSDTVSEHGDDNGNSSSKISLTVVNNLNENPSINDTSIVVDACCSVEDIREVIARGLSIGVCNFDIYYGDKVLLRGNLGEYGISRNDSLIVKPRKRIPNVTEQFVITVRNTTDDLRTDKEQRYLIDYFQTVESVKRNLREQYNVNIDCIKLFFDAKELHDADVIQELDIPNGSMLEWRIEEIEKTCTTGINIVVRKNLSASDVSGSEQIRVPGDTTIASLRSQLETVFDLSSVKYVISFGGELFENENTINTYNIKDGDEIVISRSLLVRYFRPESNSTPSNRFSFLSTDYVSDLKEKITKKINIPARAILLTFDGNALDDDKRLEDYDIENDSHVMMVATLSGGSRLSNDLILYD